MNDHSRNRAKKITATTIFALDTIARARPDQRGAMPAHVIAAVHDKAERFCNNFHSYRETGAIIARVILSGPRLPPWDTSPTQDR